MKPIDEEDFVLPGNPFLNCTVAEFLEEQKKQLKEKGDPEGKYKCMRCGDCCLFNYYLLAIKGKLIDQLYMLGSPYPHGYWVLIDFKIHCYMPLWSKKSQSNLLHFDGYLPREHMDFLSRTGRRHGYWVLNNENDKIVVYNPVPCIHFVKDINMIASCAIYKDRPKVCRDYICGRYPE